MADLRGFLLGLALLLNSGAAHAQTESAATSGEHGTVIPISPQLCNDMKKHRVLNAGAPVGCDRLRLVKFAYVDFDGKPHADGEIVVMDAVADHVLQVFVALRQRRFPIAGAKLMNTYDGDDDVSMDHNNTSAFNVRPMAGGGPILLHAYGAAIDLNPIQNPYLRRSGERTVVSPKAGAEYLNRKVFRPGMAESIIGIFAEHGFTIWGGRWRNPIDYQHFQISHRFADQLARSRSAEARALFERHVQKYRACLQRSAGGERPTQAPCAAENY